MKPQNPLEILQVAADLLQDVTGEHYQITTQWSGSRVVGFTLRVTGRAWVIRDRHGAYLAERIAQGRRGPYRKGWTWTLDPAAAYHFKRRRDAVSARFKTDSQGYPSVQLWGEWVEYVRIEEVERG